MVGPLLWRILKGFLVCRNTALGMRARSCTRSKTCADQTDSEHVAFAMLEVSDSIILAQRIQYYPITRAILDLSLRLGDGLYVASALGVWAMLLLTLTILAANALLGRKLGAVFRI